MDLKELLGEAYKEGMTFEEAEAALKNVTPPDASARELVKLKADLSKAHADTAKYKEKLRSKQTEDEAAAAAQQEAFEKLTQENAELKRSVTLSTHKAKLLAMGYEEQLAESTAAAMADGDTDTMLANQKKFLEAQTQAALAAKMKETPRPAAGGESGTSAAEYQKKIEEAQACGDYSAAAYYTRLMGELQTE